MSKAKARAVFERLRDNPNKVYIIHYSCESWIDKTDGFTPRISSIAIRSYESGQTHSFSIHKVAELEKVKVQDLDAHFDRLERLMLDEYFTFIAKHNDYYYAHWNMRDINYGFEALKHRYRVLGGTPVDIDHNRLVDLARALVDLYGPHYIGHPRFEKLLDKNHIVKKDFLTGREEAECFVRKEYVKLHNSTLRKVDSLAEIISLQTRGQLKTDANRLGQFLDDVMGHWVYRTLTVLLALVGLIKLIGDAFTVLANK